MSKMPVSTTSAANSKISCPLLLQLFQEGGLWSCVTINIAESEYKTPVANIKKNYLAILAGNILMRFETELFRH